MQKGIIFTELDEAETGNAGEQPARNNPIGGNVLGVVYESASKILIYSYQSMPKKTQKVKCVLHIFLKQFVQFTLKQYTIDAIVN
jgi:hypothetical protein